ncbi:MAG: SusD/RagB family nutrient-binding outer membrane lipoprotein, partial [Segetibacter sp.]
MNISSILTGLSVYRPSLVFTGVANDLNIDKPWSLISRWNQFDAVNYNYYGDQRYDWTGASWNYGTLNNVERMVQEAKGIGLSDVNQYSALAKFFKAFFYYRMTSLNGDLPVNEALKSIEVPTPKYDPQKDVFMQIIKWLNEANSDLETVIGKSGDTKIERDFYF